MKNLSEIRKFVDMGRAKGILGFIKEAVLYALMTIISVLLLNPDMVYKHFKNAEDQQHMEYVNKRLAADPKIRSILRETMFELGATRSYIFELHNGTNNFAGLPFLYGDMKYEEVPDGYPHIDDMYNNFNLTRYPFISHTLGSGFWSGTTAEVKIIDNRFSSNLERDGIGYSAYIVVCGVEKVIGIYGVTYETGTKDPIPSVDLIRNKMTTAAQKLSVLLSV